MEATLALHDGSFELLDDLSVGIRTHALRYGTGVFEGIRTYWNADRSHLLVFRAPEHYARLTASVAMLHMRMQSSVTELCSATAAA